MQNHTMHVSRKMKTNTVNQALFEFKTKPSEWVDLDDEIPELDLSQCAAWMRDLAEIQWRDFINQDPLTLSVLFLPCDVFSNMFLVENCLFLSKILWTIFVIIKVEWVPSQQLKRSISLPHDVTVNTNCYETMCRWCCFGNWVTSQWVGDVVIVTK